MADHKSAIADKSEKERWGKTMDRDIKQQVVLVKNSIFIGKEETSMKHLLYNEGNLEGVKTEV